MTEVDRLTQEIIKGNRAYFSLCGRFLLDSPQPVVYIKRNMKETKGSGILFFACEDGKATGEGC